jgi:hypothetical protein
MEFLRKIFPLHIAREYCNMEKSTKPTAGSKGRILNVQGFGFRHTVGGGAVVERKGRMMCKASGLAILAAVAMSWSAVSCSGPVFFKPAAVSMVSTPAPTPGQTGVVVTTAPTQSKAATGADTANHGGAPAKPMLANAPISNVPVPSAPIPTVPIPVAPSPSNVVASAPESAPANSLASTAPASATPVAAAEAASSWSGAGIFALFALALFVAIVVSNLISRDRAPKKI